MEMLQIKNSRPVTYYLKKGNIYRITDEDSVNISTSLPSRTFVVKQDQFGFFLDPVDNLEPHRGKIYGNSTNHCDRITNTFLERPGNTGVMLSGEKGSGKTLLARSVAIKCQQEHDMPVIIVNTPFHGENFNTFIQSITQPCVLFFDEYEKTYSDTDHRNALLTLMDGVFVGKKLFLLTSNETYVSHFMENRPGRIFYSIKFDSLDEKFILEYVEDNLHNKDNQAELISLSKFIPRFNFDMLKSIIEEMNRYDETSREAINILNIELPRQEYYDFKVKSISHPEIEIEGISSKYHIQPFDRFRIHFRFVNEIEEESDLFEEPKLSNLFSGEDIISVDPVHNEYRYRNSDNVELVLEKYYKTSRDWRDMY